MRRLTILAVLAAVATGGCTQDSDSTGDGASWSDYTVRYVERNVTRDLQRQSADLYGKGTDVRSVQCVERRSGDGAACIARLSVPNFGTERLPIDVTYGKNGTFLWQAR